jgi:methylaspartate ammonia-lyase
MRIVDVLAVPVQAGFFFDDQLAIRAGAGHDETDRSAQVTAHVAMACQAAQVLAKPGMGVDEGLMIARMVATTIPGAVTKTPRGSTPCAHRTRAPGP